MTVMRIKNTCLIAILVSQNIFERNYFKRYCIYLNYEITCNVGYCFNFIFPDQIRKSFRRSKLITLDFFHNFIFSISTLEKKMELSADNIINSLFFLPMIIYGSINYSTLRNE